MYWAVREDGGYEIIDGQQRTISICQYVNGDYSVDGYYFHNLQNEEKEKILEYKLMVYQCSGTDKEKLEWFKIINIAGEKLKDQELRNAVYHGTWLSDAKRYFSKRGCAAYSIGEDYINGSVIRQDYLERVLSWISDDNIEEYMAKNQHNQSARELYEYLELVINWVKYLFPTYKKEMKGIEWGLLYNKYHTETSFNSVRLEPLVKKLMEDEEVENKRGIYQYVFDGKEKHLNLRLFSQSDKRTKYEEQNGVCVKCNNEYTIEEMEADHIKPWSLGGKTTIGNLQLLCVDCNRTKSNN